jgi:hypothetical protein
MSASPNRLSAVIVPEESASGRLRAKIPKKSNLFKSSDNQEMPQLIRRGIFILDK